MKGEESESATDQEARAAGPGEEIVDGELYEYPFHVADFHGRVIKQELDTIPPFLHQEEIDVLSAELQNVVTDEEVNDYRRSVLVNVLRKLPDLESGRGEVPQYVE